MTSKREQVLAAVLSLIETACPAATVKRNVPKPARIGPGGSIVIRDGEPGEPEVILSPVTYLYDHRIVIEIVATGTAAEATIDALMVAIAGAVMGARTLSGLCEWLETEAPVTGDLDAEGADPGRWADAAIIASYTTDNPLR